MSILYTINKYLSWTKEEEFADFIVELIEKYWISNQNENDIYARYYDNTYSIPSTWYSMGISVWVMSIHKWYWEVLEYKEKDYWHIIINDAIKEKIKYQEKQKSIVEKAKLSQKIDTLMMEDWLKYLENIERTWEFDEVFNDIKKFKELSEEAKMIYEKYNT